MKNVIIEAKEGLNWRHFVHSLLKLFLKSCPEVGVLDAVFSMVAR